MLIHIDTLSRRRTGNEWVSPNVFGGSLEGIGSSETRRVFPFPVSTFELTDCRYDATMKGAVLYRLGMHLVRERVLRSNYGTIMDMPFRWGVHPKERRFRHMSGQTRCR